MTLFASRSQSCQPSSDKFVAPSVIAQAMNMSVGRSVSTRRSNRTAGFTLNPRPLRSAETGAVTGRHWSLRDLSPAAVLRFPPPSRSVSKYLSISLTPLLPSGHYQQRVNAECARMGAQTRPAYDKLSLPNTQARARTQCGLQPHASAIASAPNSPLTLHLTHILSNPSRSIAPTQLTN